MYCVPGWTDLILLKRQSSPKLIYRFNTTPVKISADFLHKIDDLSLNFTPTKKPCSRAFRKNCEFCEYPKMSVTWSSCNHCLGLPASIKVESL